MATRKRPESRCYVPRVREADVQKACVDFMALDGWRPLKTDPCSDRARGKGFGEEGMADHLFIRYPNDNSGGWAEVLWVEFKRPAGMDGSGRMCAATKATTHQKIWHSAERAAGAMTAIAGEDFEPTFDGFVAWYRTTGLLHREGL